MQSFELLGGKYQQGEQILPGAIQSFRSYEVPTGRPVFIHRVASNDPAAQEIADLLSAGLIRSPAVRKMLVDVYETEPYRFIVTEPARQCVPLRDWLEREANEAPDAVSPLPAATAKIQEPAARAVKAAAGPELEPPLAEEAAAVPPPEQAESAEFARLFQQALSGKLERSRRKEAQQENPALPRLEPESDVEPIVAAPANKAAVPAAEEMPVATPAPPLQASGELFTQGAAVERAGKSTLIIFLVVLAVLVLLVVMFIVVFVKR